MKIIPILLAGLVAAFILLLMSMLVYEAIDSNEYREIESKIIIEEHYENVENKRAAVGRCMQTLETNGYTMHKASTECHGDKKFIVISGIKYSKKDIK